MKKSQRITISGRNFEFLKTVAEQMDESDLTAALSYLLTDVRCLGWRVGDKPQPQQAPIGYTHFDTSTFEKVVPITAPVPDYNHNYSEDPIIARMAALLEDF